jgi:hypothetical protein
MTTHPYTIDRSSNWRRQAVAEAIWGLDLVQPALREDIVTAWVTTWAASPYERLEDMPWTEGVDYPLLSHVNEVTRAGIDLAARAGAEWNMDLPRDVLVPILVLHDVDKPLMYERKAGAVVRTALADEIPHGVVGGMLLKELGFIHEVVATVTTHSPKMPYRGRNACAYVLHHADMFSADHAMMVMGRTPFYVRHG